MTLATDTNSLLYSFGEATLPRNSAIVLAQGEARHDGGAAGRVPGPPVDPPAARVVHKFHFLGTTFLSERKLFTKKFLFLGTYFHFKRNCHNPTCRPSCTPCSCRCRRGGGRSPWQPDRPTRPRTSWTPSPDPWYWYVFSLLLGLLSSHATNL